MTSEITSCYFFVFQVAESFNIKPALFMWRKNTKIVIYVVLIRYGCAINLMCADDCKKNQMYISLLSWGSVSVSLVVCYLCNTLVTLCLE